MAQAVLEPRSDAVDPDSPCGLLDLGVGRLRPREPEVVRDRPAEQERVLQHHAELPPVRA